MNCPKMIASLERFGRMLPVVLRDVDLEDARWKPPDGAWSILEVVCHLADEEELDFRKRVERTLADPDQPWPPINPEGWSVERHYNEGKLDEAVARFSLLRDQSVSWLRSLDSPDWTQTHQHPKFGSIRAGDILAAWVAHDCLHLRQIAKRMYQMAGRDAGEYSTRYAGEWGA
jgi:hypothetical protein